jgi:hypothetical protein
LAFVAQLFENRDFYTSPPSRVPARNHDGGLSATTAGAAGAAGAGAAGDPETDTDTDAPLLLPVVGVVTHGEMVRALYEALGQGSYDARNTQVVPLMIERRLLWADDEQH